MTCSEIRDRLALLVYGDLPPQETAQVRDHLQACPACRHEEAALRQVRHLLDAVPAPRVSIDLAGLYRQAAAQQTRRTRWWRRTAVAMTGLAATVVLLAVAPHFEVRVEAHQVSLRWADIPAPVAPTPTPTPAPHPPVPKAAAPAPAPAAKFGEQMQVVSELIHGHQEELTQLQDQIAELRQQLAASARRWQSTERDVAALSSNPIARP
jgi:anti-sigma factor RsiW